ncbi:site-specific integrase [Streptosporangium canum]|uniref:site-specific integrase n=1 Tax=Streptosporangium canum TaxID=324952 RepID=UPI0034134497
MWRLKELGIECDYRATICFDDIPQPWLKKLVKRWTCWRLASGLSPATGSAGAKALARFGQFLAARNVEGLTQVDRRLVERYLADLHAEGLSAGMHRDRIGQLNLFFAAIRRHASGPRGTCLTSYLGLSGTLLREPRAEQARRTQGGEEYRVFLDVGQADIVRRPEHRLPCSS